MPVSQGWMVAGAMPDARARKAEKLSRRIGRTAVLAVAAVLMGTGTAEAATVYVAVGGSGSTCSSTAPCGTFDAAYDRAAPGDRVEVAAGSYGTQSITGDKGSSTPVVIEPAAGATAQVNGDLDVRADYVTVRNIPASGGYDVDNSEPANPIVGVRLENVRGPMGYFQNVRDFTLKGGDLGGLGGVKVITIGAWPGSSNIVIDGVYLHDNPPLAADQHMECIFAVHVAGLTVRNNRFNNCGYFAILTGRCCGGDQDWRDLRIENNVFGPTRCFAGAGGCPSNGQAPWAMHLGSSTSSAGENYIRNNLFLTPPSIDAGSLDTGRFSNNVGAHGSCASGIVYSNNILNRGTAGKCAASDMHADIRSHYDVEGRLTNASSAAIGFANAADVPAGDRFGEARDSDPDAGPDELGSAPPPLPPLAPVLPGDEPAAVGPAVMGQNLTLRAALTVSRVGPRVVSLCSQARSHCRNTTARLRFRVSRRARLVVSVARLARESRVARRVMKLERRAKRRNHALRLGGRALKVGRYRVSAVAIDADGQRSRPARAMLTVRR